MAKNRVETARDIAAGFRIEGKPVSADPFGSGHINETFLVTTDSPERKNYILQKINRRVFTDVPALMENIERVTSGMRQRLASGPGQFPGFCVPGLIESAGGARFLEDDQGQCWRMFDHVPGSVSIDRVEDEGLAAEAGKAYGWFLSLAGDLDPACLHDTIPGFHDFGKRWNAFQATRETDRVNRARQAGGEIDFVMQRAADMYLINEGLEQGIIPLRVTHNDTKINNILFNSQRRAMAVVDLDTVMKGSLLFDFGDAIRTGASMADEDEPDPARTGISLPLFRAYASGFMAHAKGMLTAEETGLLAFSARFMTFLIGLRFLTDHLDGDRYFRTRFPGHNLQRARAQFGMVRDMERKSGAMETIIQDLVETGSE